MRKKFFKLLFLVLILSLFACSANSNIKMLNQAIQKSSIGDSAISYNEKDWFDFKKQETEIQDYYLTYLKEIGECLVNAKFEKAKEEDFEGTDSFSLKLNADNKNYELTVRYVYPDTGYLKVSVDNKTEYYFLNQESNKQLSDIIIESDNRPFNHISLLEYLENENR